MSEISDLIECVGPEATLKLVEAYGGTRLIVPKDPPKTHPLVDLLGAADAKRLIRRFAGVVLMVPMARDWRFAIYDARGLTRREIALRLHVTEKTVYARFRRKRLQDSQMTFSFEKERTAC